GGPPVLENEDRGRRTRLDHRSSIVEVALVEQARRGTFEDREVEVAVDVAHVDDFERTVVTAAHEEEVEDADQPAVDEVDQDREPFTRHLASWELHDQIADRSHRGIICHFRTTFLRTSLWTRSLARPDVPRPCVAWRTRAVVTIRAHAGREPSS